MPEPRCSRDRKSTRLNSSHTVIYTLSLHDALPIFTTPSTGRGCAFGDFNNDGSVDVVINNQNARASLLKRSEEHTSELQSHSDLHSFPTRRSSDLYHTIHRTGLRLWRFQQRRQCRCSD